MTMHPACPPVARNPERELREALRVARAASHARRLDTATQAALDAIVAFASAATERILQHERALADALERITAMERVQRRSPVRRIA